jgi:hypothetical protein
MDREMGTLTAAEMQRALWRHYSPRCAVLFEISTNLRPEDVKAGSGPFQMQRRRRVDALVVSRARKQGTGELDLIALEIKVSRADFLADLHDVAKQAAWREVATRHAYAVPAGLVAADEVPPSSGLLAVTRPAHPGAYQYDIKWARRAPYGGGRPVPGWLTLTLAHRLAVAEAKIRGVSGAASETAEATAEELRAGLVEARQRASLLQEQLDRAHSEISEWRGAFAAAGHLPCHYCRKPVIPSRMRGGHIKDWRHVSAADEPPCAVLRSAEQWAYVHPCDDVTAAEALEELAS